MNITSGNCIMVLESNIGEILPRETVFMVLESNNDGILPLETVFMGLESILIKYYIWKLYLWLERPILMNKLPLETLFMVLKSNIDEILPLETVFMVLKSNIYEILPLETVFMVLESNIDEVLPLETVFMAPESMLIKYYLWKLYLWFESPILMNKLPPKTVFIVLESNIDEI